MRDHSPIAERPALMARVKPIDQTPNTNGSGKVKKRKRTEPLPPKKPKHGHVKLDRVPRKAKRK